MADDDGFDFMMVDDDALGHLVDTTAPSNPIAVSMATGENINTSATTTHTMTETWSETQRYAAPEQAVTFAHIAFRPSEPLQRFLNSLKHLIRASESPDTMRLVVQIIRHTVGDSEKVFEAQAEGQHADLRPPSIIPYVSYGDAHKRGDVGGKFGQLRITTPLATQPELGFAFDSVAPCAVIDPIRPSQQYPLLPVGMGPAAEVLATQFVTVFESFLQKCVVAQSPLSLYFHRSHFEFKAQFKRMDTSVAHNVSNAHPNDQTNVNAMEESSKGDGDPQSTASDVVATPQQPPTTNRHILCHNVAFVSRTDMNIAMQKKMQCTTQDDPMPDPTQYDPKRDHFIPPLALQCQHHFLGVMLAPLAMAVPVKNEHPTVILDVDFTYLPDAPMASTCSFQPWAHESFLGSHVEMMDVPPPSRHIMHVYERSVTDSEVGSKTHIPLKVVTDQALQALPRQAYDHFVEVCGPDTAALASNPMHHATSVGVATFHYPRSKFASLLRMLDMSDGDSDFHWWLPRDYRGHQSLGATAAGNVAQRMNFQARFFKAANGGRPTTNGNNNRNGNPDGAQPTVGSNNGVNDTPLSMSSPCWISLSLFPSMNAVDALAFADYVLPRGNPVYRAIESGDTTSAFHPMDDIAFSNMSDSFMLM